MLATRRKLKSLKPVVCPRLEHDVVEWLNDCDAYGINVTYDAINFDDFQLLGSHQHPWKGHGGALNGLSEFALRPHVRSFLDSLGVCRVVIWLEFVWTCQYQFLSFLIFNPSHLFPLMGVLTVLGGF